MAPPHGLGLEFQVDQKRESKPGIRIRFFYFLSVNTILPVASYIGHQAFPAAAFTLLPPGLPHCDGHTSAPRPSLP